MKNVLDQDVSLFRQVTKPTHRNVNLYTFLSSDCYYSKQKEIAQLKLSNYNMYQYRKIHELPLVTPGAICSLGKMHGNNNIEKLTGIMQIDIDGKDNSHIDNWSNLRDDLFDAVENAAYAGLSVSGSGCYLLIPVMFPEKQEQHLNYMNEYLSSNGLAIDTTKGRPSSLRCYSYDPHAKFRLDANALEPFLEPKKENTKEYANKTKFSDQLPIWEQFNKSEEWEKVLIAHGWKYSTKRGDELHYTRPGKTRGTSATFNSRKRVLNVFTDSGGLLNPGGWSPMGILANLEFGGDFKAATKWLIDNEKQKQFVQTINSSYTIDYPQQWDLPFIPNERDQDIINYNKQLNSLINKQTA